MGKWIDIPPVWLFGALALVWAVGPRFGLSFGGWSGPVGAALIGLGLGLIFGAVVQMIRARTTPVPHQEADALMTTGLFAISRNPIYLGDSLILLGCILRWDAMLALPVLPCFVWVIQARFIVAEEAMLRRKFVANYDYYTQRTRRWL